MTAKPPIPQSRVHPSHSDKTAAAQLTTTERRLIRLTDAILTAGGSLALETDTVPGLATAALKPSALAELYTLKQRSVHKPFVWLIGNLNAVRGYIKLSPLAQTLIAKHWPGALTIIFPLSARGKQLLAALPGQPQKLALRIPADPFLCTLLTALSTPLAVTSANFSGMPPLPTLAAVRELFGFKITAYLERKVPMSGAASTVLDLSDDKPVILRQGAVKIACD